MAQAQAAHGSDKYYIPHGSKWPAVGAVTLFVTMLGTSAVLNGWNVGPWIAWLGLAGVAYMFFGWFGTVIDESQRGLYNAGVDRSFRMGMTWFIFSEVMFFAAFFGALFYARQLSVPWLGGEGSRFTTNLFLWPDFEATWPTNGPAGIGGDFQTIPAFGLPAINTAILLTSGVTITIAHHALKAGNRGVLKIFLEPDARLGRVRLDVLHAHRLPRPARHARRDHAAGDLAARDERSLHADAPLRLRGDRVVLALRGRGVAGAVHLRVLAVSQ